jgi:hypothetical protein
VTYDVEALVPHATHRVLEVRARAGGKGVNVAGRFASSARTRWSPAWSLATAAP